MEEQAAEKLGEPVLAGSIVQTSGAGKAAMRGGAVGATAGAIGGIVGGAIADAVSGRMSGPEKDLLGYQGLLYLAVGPTRVGFFRLRQGLLKASVGDVLGILRRDAVTAMTVGGGFATAPVAIVLNDGTTIALEVPRIHKGRAEKVAALFPSAVPPAPPSPGRAPGT